MAYSSPVEERRLQYLARAEEAREKAEQTAHPEIRGWWTNAAEAWEYLAAHPETRLAPLRAMWDGGPANSPPPAKLMVSANFRLFRHFPG